jgi:hypothetical protein
MRDMPDSFVAFLVFVLGPAVIGVTALVVGIRTLSNPKRGFPNTTAQNILGVGCLVVAFGIGACYALELIGSLSG